MEDVQLMHDNCYEYNRQRNPHLLPAADFIQDAFENQFREVTYNQFYYFVVPLLTLHL